MIAELSLSAIAEELGSEFGADVKFGKVSTDTRDIQNGELFVALNGDNFDGNQFVKEANKKGAGAAIVSATVDCDIPQLLVEDTRIALGVIARTNRRLFRGKVIGLTGSAGKTTCKEMVAAILSEKGPVLATKSNFNNEIGVPLTLLEINSGHIFAVVEMGASAIGDIRYLAQFVEPDIALVTNAEEVHVEGFGDLASIAKTKGEIFESLNAAGTAVINKDDRYFDQWRGQAGDANVVSFSKDNNRADFYAENIQVHKTGATQFELRTKDQKISIALKLLGEHNVSNAIAASAVAVSAGANFQQVKLGLEKINPVPGRLQTKMLRGLAVIDDTYNASPASVKAAIDVLAGITGKRTLVLGTMGELGAKAEEFHREVACYAKDKGIDQLLAVGEFSTAVVSSFEGSAKSFSDMAGLIGELNLLSESNVVLVKGSRSAHMERFVAALIDESNLFISSDNISSDNISSDNISSDNISSDNNSDDTASRLDSSGLDGFQPANDQGDT